MPIIHYGFKLQQNKSAHVHTTSAMLFYQIKLKGKEVFKRRKLIILLALLESAYSLIWAAHRIWGNILAVL